MGRGTCSVGGVRARRASAMRGREKSAHGRFLYTEDYRNRLPDAFGEPKLLRTRFDARQHVSYQAELGARYARDYHVDAEGIHPVALMDMERYVVDEDEEAVLDPADAALVEAAQQVAGGPRAKSREVSWLMYTKYITDQADNRDTKFDGARIQESEDEEADGDPRETLIRDIERGFAAVRKDPVHPTKPDLKPIEVVPLMPGFENWANDYVEVVFDYEPLRDDPEHKNLSKEELEFLEDRAVIKSFTVQGEVPGSQQEVKDSFVAYAVPKKKEETGQGSQSKHVSGGEYTWVREYKYETGRVAEENKGTTRGLFVVNMNQGSATFNPINQRINLKRKARVDLDRIGFTPPSQITVERRDFTPEELAERQAVLDSVQHPSSS